MLEDLSELMLVTGSKSVLENSVVPDIQLALDRVSEELRHESKGSSLTSCLRCSGSTIVCLISSTRQLTLE